MNPFESLFTDLVVSTLVAKVATLPPDKQEDAIMDIIGQYLVVMSVEKITELRQMIVKEYGEHSDFPLVVKVLELMDGHVALREMASTTEPTQS
jgi:hypothetical protein